MKYITTPLFYVNARPHLGHAYTTILGDVLKRHYLQRGDDVTLLTGTDEHGEKIARMAKERNLSDQALADEVSADFQDTWQRMGIDFDVFYRTTDPAHRRAVQHALTYLKDRGEIVFREYEGNYCVGCERFLTDTELTPDSRCPDHLTPPERRKEGNYFFLMSRYQQRLVEHYERNPSTIRPEQYRSEVLAFLREPLGDLCISRPKTRLTWGIEIPFDDRFVTYVWFDALLNYFVATGYPGEINLEKWRSANHLIAKDILKAHAIYWPTMLMALGAPLFRELNVSGYWLVDGTKMSKSLGNVVRPLEVEARFGAETLRYYLLREMSYGQDSTFTLEAFVNSINANLANGFGNLVSRALTLCKKGFQGTIPGNALTAEDQALLDQCRRTVEIWNDAFEERKFHLALKAWGELITACDLYINGNKPWALVKLPEQSERLQAVLGTCLRAIQTIGVLIYPVLPRASLRVCEALGLGKFEFNRTYPPLALALDHRSRYDLGEEVPKLFMRVALPVEPEAEDPSAR